MTSASLTGEIRRARAAVFDEFLVGPELTALAHFVLANEGRFGKSQIVSSSAGDDGSDPGYRRSRVTVDLGPFGKLFAERIRCYFRQILSALRHPEFDIRWIEPQLTASNDGDFFKIHNDNTQADAPSREITFVYFFHREPKPFSGGELLIYDWRMQNGYPIPASVRRTIVPRQNEVVFFPSACLHEVCRVACPSGAFWDSRFTLNGWIHR